MNAANKQNPAFQGGINGKEVYEIQFKTVINFDSGFRKKLLCDGPTFSAGVACAYRCEYCYVPAITRKLLAKYDLPDGVVVRRGSPVHTAIKQLETPKGKKLAEQKLVVFASPLVDVAANVELAQETVDLCGAILCRTAWDIRLLSKSNLLPKVAEGLRRIHPSYSQRVIYGVSTGTIDDNIARAIEPGTALPSMRLKSLHWLQDNGYRTFGMICPSLPQADFNEFSEQVFAAIRADRCEHVWAEVLNSRGESFKRTHAALEQVDSIAAIRFDLVMRDRDLWEGYAMDTFEAHARVCPPGKLRFMQYTTKATQDWWAARIEKGAVLL